MLNNENFHIPFRVLEESLYSEGKFQKVSVTPMTGTLVSKCEQHLWWLSYAPLPLIESNALTKKKEEENDSAFNPSSRISTRFSTRRNRGRNCTNENSFFYSRFTGSSTIQPRSVSSNFTFNAPWIWWKPRLTYSWTPWFTISRSRFPTAYQTANPWQLLRIRRTLSTLARWKLGKLIRIDRFESKI